ncbi:MAG: hypothetical protein OES41_03975, partial [Rhodospirillales bacterium]|nr:hypothetical protein [Rhodospirillales bacterium]
RRVASIGADQPGLVAALLPSARPAHRIFSLLVIIFRFFNIERNKMIIFRWSKKETVILCIAKKLLRG